MLRKELKENMIGLAIDDLVILVGCYEENVDGSDGTSIGTGYQMLNM